MKTPKLILAVFALFLFANFSFGANPNTESSEVISDRMVEHTNKDVNLTYVQKETLKKKAKEYAEKLLQARSMSNKEESYVFMRTVTANYKAALDSILSSEQKIQKEKKRMDRIDAVVTKGKSKK